MLTIISDINDTALNAFIKFSNEINLNTAYIKAAAKYPNGGQTSSNDRLVIEGALVVTYGVWPTTRTTGKWWQERGWVTSKHSSSRRGFFLLACSSWWKAGWTCWTSWLMDPYCTPPINLPPPRLFPLLLNSSNFPLLYDTPSATGCFV